MQCWRAARVSGSSTQAGGCLAERPRLQPCRTARGGGRVAAAAGRRIPSPPSPEQQSALGVNNDKLASVLTCLALTGASTGTFLDGIHSRVGLLQYDQLPLTLGGLHTSMFVPPLLATFYAALGAICIFADTRMMASDGSTQHAVKNASLSRMALSFGALAAMLGASSVLYTDGAPFNTISVVLAACATANFLIFDGTKQGLALAVLCAVAAPAGELLLMQTLGLWHYPEGNMLNQFHGGIPSWVPWCYFMYCPAVLNLSRYLRRVM